jgi:hypothetical protein
LFLFEFEVGLGLVLAEAAGGDIRFEVVLTFDGSACHATKHGELADVIQSVGDWALEEFFGRGVEGLRTGEILVELLKRGEEAMNFVVPRQGLGIVPGGLAFGPGEGPIEKIAEVRKYLQRRARGFGGAETGEGVRRIVDDLRTAIGDCGEAVAKEITSAGGWRDHKEVKLAACVWEEKNFCGAGASKRRSLGPRHAVHGAEEETKCRSERV